MTKRRAAPRAPPSTRPAPAPNILGGPSKSVPVRPNSPADRRRGYWTCGRVLPLLYLADLLSTAALPVRSAESDFSRCPAVSSGVFHGRNWSGRLRLLGPEPGAQLRLRAEL